jgi:hypothetical protein
MPENPQELVDRMHRDAVERYPQEPQKWRELVEALKGVERESVKRQLETELVETAHREAVERLGHNSKAPVDPGREIHHTDLPEANPNQILAQEWNTYRREVGRLLAEGQEGKFVLIKDTTLVGIFDTWDEAREEGLRRFSLQPMMVKQVCTFEPILRARGYNLPWPNSLFRLSPPG